MLVANSQKFLKDLTEKIVDNDEILNIVKEIGEEERTIKDLKKAYPDKIRELEEALLNYIGENNPENLETEILVISGSI